MNFDTPLVKGTLIKRYKRFLADITLENGEEITAHCPNTGSMKTCGDTGDTVFLIYNPSPKRKLDYTWEYTQNADGYIGINTARPNRIVEEAIAKGQIESLNGYSSMRREVKYGEGSRIDLLLEGTEEKPDEKCWVEVKNATLYHDGQIIFPDAVTARGLKHLNELMNQVKLGDRAVMFYLINRPDGESFSVAKDIDPAYGEGLVKAINSGVEVLAYRVDSTLESMTIGKKVKIEI